MEICCDLEVDVNGEETFMVDKVLFMLYFSISLFSKIFIYFSANYHCKMSCLLLTPKSQLLFYLVWLAMLQLSFICVIASSTCNSQRYSHMC